ncbi:hypothetical protein pb186bvf_000433 [Paramecium bursaria]
MKQSEELGNPFKECQMYVADLADPLTLVEFLEDITPIRITKQLEPLNKTQQMNPKPPKTANPYQSDWANTILKEQFQVEVQMVSQRNGTKWVIKKLKDSDSAESEPKMSRQEMKSQEKLFSHTASQSNRKKLTKFINQYRKSYNGSIIEKKPKQRSDLFEYITPMPIFDINFQKKYLPNI